MAFVIPPWVFYQREYVFSSLQQDFFFFFRTKTTAWYCHFDWWKVDCLFHRRASIMTFGVFDLLTWCWSCSRGWTPAWRPDTSLCWPAGPWHRNSTTFSPSQCEKKKSKDLVSTSGIMKQCGTAWNAVAPACLQVRAKDTFLDPRSSLSSCRKRSTLCVSV